MKSIVFLILGTLFYQTALSQWTQQISNTTFNLNDVFFISNDSGLAVGDNGRITTTVDGGSNWTELNAIPTCNLNSVFFSSPDSGWIASTCGIHFTSDGGLNWSLQTSGNGEEINDIFFSNAQYGWAVGNKLTIMRTIDGGNNWIIDTLTSNVANNPLLTVYFRDSTNGWIGGGEKLHFTSDGGQNWTQGSSFLIDWIYSIDFGDDFSGVAAGMGGSTTNTFDWGNNWNFSGSVTPSFEYIYGVNFSSEDSVFMVGEAGLIYFSNNSGSTWILQSSGVTENLNAVHFPRPNIGFAVGNAGTIIKYSQSVGVHNNISLLDDYKIYPNPVLNQLTINSELAISKISIMDFTGKLITTINHQTKLVDVSNLPYGIYFIKIMNKEVSITKKFVKQ
jgi:photosystem II stability/assembly factor-like uncharacterized protein